MTNQQNELEFLPIFTHKEEDGPLILNREQALSVKAMLTLVARLRTHHPEVLAQAVVELSDNDAEKIMISAAIIQDLLESFLQLAKLETTN